MGKERRTHMAIVQFRVDDELKKQATEVFENLGIDLSTAMRMFLKKSVMCNGIPFLVFNQNEPDDYLEAMQLLRQMQKISEANGNSEMTLDEINRIIALAREKK